MVFISMDATNAFPCPMLYLSSVLDSFLNLYLFIFQIMRSLSLSSCSTLLFPVFNNCVSKDLSACCLCLLYTVLVCAAELEGYWQASLDFRENNHRLNVTEKDSLTLQKPPTLCYFLCFSCKKIIPAAEIIPCAAKNMFL